MGLAKISSQEFFLIGGNCFPSVEKIFKEEAYHSKKRYLWEVYMRQAKCGDRVAVHYTGKLENGEVFANSKVGEPFEFTIGKGEVIPGFEKGVTSMEVGETKTITVPSAEAYGPTSEELLIQIKKSFLPENITPAIGEQLQIPQKGGNPIDVTIFDMDEDTVTLDANHPLAGITVIFNFLLVAIT